MAALLSVERIKIIDMVFAFWLRTIISDERISSEDLLKGALSGDTAVYCPMTKTQPLSEQDK